MADNSTPRDVGGTSDVGGASGDTLSGVTYLRLICPPSRVDRGQIERYHRPVLQRDPRRAPTGPERDHSLDITTDVDPARAIESVGGLPAVVGIALLGLLVVRDVARRLSRFWARSDASGTGRSGH